MSDAVTYDRFTTYDGRPCTPFRSEALYIPDERKMYRSRPGAAVQVIREHGDLVWTDAVYDHMDSIEDGMIVRFYVIIDGERVMVSADRIRVKA